MSFDMGSMISPWGLMMPLTTRTIREIRRIGVRTFPTMSTTLEGLRVSSSTTAKKITENTARAPLSPMLKGEMGTMPSSKVVAAVLGMARAGPRQMMFAVHITRAALLPIGEVSFLTSASNLAAAIMATRLKPISVMK